MTTIKSYTDIEQSKKLAEILPIESADMRYGYIAPYDYSDRMYDGGYDEIPYPKDFLIKNPNFSDNEYDEELPCWSLAALIEEIPEVINFDDDESDYALEILKEGGLYYISYGNPLEGEKLNIEPQENFVDACVAMIEKLHELNLL